MSRNSKTITIRMLNDEYDAIMGAVEALSTPEMAIGPAQLFYTAALEQAATLGFTATTLTSTVRPPNGVWNLRPVAREEESTRRRITISIHPLYFRVIEAAANWVEASMPQFLVGSALSFIAARQKADKKNAPLQRIQLPEQYAK